MRIPASISRLLRKHSPTNAQLVQLTGLSNATCCRLNNQGFSGKIKDATLAPLQEAVRKLESGEFNFGRTYKKAPKPQQPKATPILVFSKNNRFLGVTEPKAIKDMPGILVIKLDD